jgi:hypothetical protein
VFTAIYGQAFFHPRTALERLLAHPRRGVFAARAVALTAITYQLVYFFLARNGGRPALFTPWLNVAPEHYYRFNQLWIVPSILLAWVASSAFAHLAARALGGQGAFEDTLIAFALAISISSWWTGAHDVITTALGFVGVLDQRAYEDAMNTTGSIPFFVIWVLMLLYLAWFVWTFIVAAKVSERLSLPRAIAAGAVGLVAYQVLFLLFNR